MVIPPGKPVYARHRDGQNCTPDSPQTKSFAWAKYVGFCTGLIFALIAWTGSVAGVRIASFNVSLGRKGPGLLLRDIARGKDRQIQAVSGIIGLVAPDILLLTGFDQDYGNKALTAFRKTLATSGVTYRYQFAPPSNAGLQSGIDLDGDGRTGGAGDAQGYGRFPGAKGMAILSKFAIETDHAQDFSTLLWRDFPNALLPKDRAGPFPSDEAIAVQRLSSKGHWAVPIHLPDGRIITILASNPTPPVFDGPEDRNGRRNHDEIQFWINYVTQKKAGNLFVIAGDLNADPRDGAGLKDAIKNLLAAPNVQDPTPTSKGAEIDAAQQGGANKGHRTAVKLDTVDWSDLKGPGNMRVDYVLPSSSLKISNSGVFWPPPGATGDKLVRSANKAGTRHRLVWVDVE